MLIPTNRSGAAQSGRGPLARRVPAPLDDCWTAAEPELEARREQLRDQRWRRRRNKIVTGVLSTGVLTGAMPVGRAVDALLFALGAK